MFYVNYRVILGFSAHGAENTTGRWQRSGQQNKGKYRGHVAKKSFRSRGQLIIFEVSKHLV